MQQDAGQTLQFVPLIQGVKVIQRRGWQRVADQLFAFVAGNQEAPPGGGLLRAAAA
ncbi:Uncharacterised protein [Serratia odorifera]|uniref:Uncharacterized protein n=1 Tax=Serratia odorifera TaxID=618 RepID=A0A3S4E6T2_SEROD|nr:Uncharacterised protein [Serratia odorifera]